MYSEFQDFGKATAAFCYEMQALIFFYEKNYGPIKNKSVCAAVSGGSDSLALLLLMNIWAKNFNWNLYCATVNHKLRPESFEEASYVKNICDRLNIEHHVLTWNHLSTLDEGKLENLAREARYHMISNFCSKKNISLIATGHNWNDQLETYELRKEQGSSQSGLAGMSQIRSLSPNLKLIRPILHFSKKYLQDFLKSQNLEWKIDSMNFKEVFKRVRMRNKINSFDKNQIKKLSDCVHDFGRKRYEIEKPAVKFLRCYVDISNFGFCSIDFREFLNIDKSVQIEILKRLIWQIGMKKYSSSIDEKLLIQIMDKKINTLGRCLIKIKKETMFIFRENRNIPKVICSNEHPILWDNRFMVRIKLHGNQYLCSSSEEYADRIPKDVLPGFPCLYENHKVKYSPEEWIKFVNFVEKPDLFDIYCGVCCEQKS